VWLALVLDSCVNQHTFGLLLALCLQLMLACVACIGAGFCVNQHAFGLLLALCLQLMLACVACIGAGFLRGQNRQSPLFLLVVAFGVVFAFCFRNLLYLQTFAFQFAFRIYKPSHLTVN
jgi:hypothetical protein